MSASEIQQLDAANKFDEVVSAGREGDRVSLPYNRYWHYPYGM